MLFLAHFDGAVLKSSLKFGVFEMLGSLAWSVGQAAEISDYAGPPRRYAEDLGQLGVGTEFHLRLDILQHPLRCRYAGDLRSDFQRPPAAQPVLHRPGPDGAG